MSAIGRAEWPAAAAPPRPSRPPSRRGDRTGNGGHPGDLAHRRCAGLQRHHAQARLGRAPVERSDRARSARGELRDRLPRPLQHFRHPRAAPPRRHAPPEPGHRLDTHRTDRVAPHAAAGRAVARRHAVHRRRRQVQSGSNVRPVGEGGPPAAAASDDRADRNSRPGHPRHPYQAAGPAHPGSTRRVGPHGPVDVRRPSGVHWASTGIRWALGRSASCPGPRGINAFSRPTPTTGVGAWTWIA